MGKKDSENERKKYIYICQFDFYWSILEASLASLQENLSNPYELQIGTERPI